MPVLHDSPEWRETLQAIRQHGEALAVQIKAIEAIQQVQREDHIALDVAQKNLLKSQTEIATVLKTILFTMKVLGFIGGGIGGVAVIIEGVVKIVEAMHK